MSHRILIVDDEESIQKMLSDYFTDCGYEVTCAGDGEEAIRQFNVSPPDLGIIDYLLPKKNGFDVARAVRANPLVASCPLILMSGVFKNPKTAVEARDEYGAIAFLDKPLDLAALERLVVTALSGGGAMSVASDSSDLELELSLDDGDDFVWDAESSAAESGVSESVSASSPLSKGQVQEIVNSRPFPEIAKQGDIAVIPVAQLLSTIRYDRLTGILDLSADSVHRRIYAVDGAPIFLQSNAEGENVGTLLYHRGRINKPDYEGCLAYMESKKLTMQRALLDLRLSTETELATAYKLLAKQLLPASMGMNSGSFTWRETDAFIGRIPEGEFESAGVLFSGIKEFVKETQVKRFFAGRENVPLVRTTEFAALLPFFRRVFGSSKLVSQIDGRNTLRDLTRRSVEDSADAALQIYALVTSGMIIIPDVSKSNLVDVAVNEAASEIMAEVSSATVAAKREKKKEEVSYTIEENEARERVRDAHGKLMGQTYFRLLEADPKEDIDKESLRDTYYRLTKQWHSDAFVSLRLGPEEEQQKEIFHRLSQAYETLTDETKRGEYLVFLDRKKKGLPTDIETVMAAESTFDEALTALKRKNYGRAHGLVSRAIALNAGEAIYIAYLGWLKYLLDTKSDSGRLDAINTLKQSIELQENLPLAYQFLGKIHEAHGKHRAAKDWYRRCLQFDEKNIEASRAIRLINTRLEKAKKGGGLLSKLLSKK